MQRCRPKDGTVIIEPPLRILFITPGFPDREDRFTPGVVDTLVALHTLGHRLDIHAIRSPPAARQTVFRGLPITRHRRIAGFAVDVRERHRREPYDRIWSIWPNLTGLAAFAAKAVLSRPLIATLAGAELADQHELRYANPRPTRLAAVLRAADRITVGSAPMAARAAARGLTTTVCPLGVDFSGVRRRSRRGAGRVVVFGDPSPVKRPGLGLAAAERIGEVTVFGGAAGFTSPRVVRRALAEHDLLVHASGHESQGIGLIEAAYAGLAVACFDVGVAQELASLGGRVVIAGRVSADGLVEAAKDALELPLDDGKRIAERFSAEACARRFAAILRSDR